MALDRAHPVERAFLHHQTGARLESSRETKTRASKRNLEAKPDEGTVDIKPHLGVNKTHTHTNTHTHTHTHTCTRARARALKTAETGIRRCKLYASPGAKIIIIVKEVCRRKTITKAISFKKKLFLFCVQD
jgi:hypothetical protein